MKRGPKTRTKAERETHLGKVAALYSQGVRQYKIAEQLGVDPSMITYDMRILRKRWAKASTGKIDKWKASELEKLNHLESTYWQAWLDSCDDAVKVSKQKSVGAEVVTNRQEVSKPGGDPRYLAGVQWCVERRAKLLGLDAPEEHTVFAVDIVPKYVRINPVAAEHNDSDDAEDGAVAQD